MATPPKKPSSSGRRSAAARPPATRPPASRPPQGRPPQGRPPGGRRVVLPRRAGARSRLPWRRLAYWLAVVGLWGTILSGGLIAWFAWDLPAFDRLTAIDKRPAIRLLAADGTAFATLGDLYGEALDYEAFPPVLRQAVLAIEDRRFFDHGGFDAVGLLRAAWTNLVEGHLVQGGSTISQQAVKTVFLGPERTLKRKVQEAILTIELEGHLSKREILALYLNRVYLGAGAYGMDGAARRYFGSSARDLTLPQAAMLAGLMKAPSRLSPFADWAAAVRRANLVLDTMVEAGFITPEAAARAKANPARTVKRPGGDAVRYFSDWVVERIPDYIGPSDDDLVVKTTLDLKAQNAAAAALAAGLGRDGGRGAIGQGAVVALGLDGAVRAMVGGRDYQASSFNRAANGLRQPGSAFKLFVYLAALEAGLTPDSVELDGPVDIGGYRPANHNGGYAGPVTLAQAFAQSINTVAVKLLARVGAGAVVEMAQRLGITSPIPRNASIALGSAEVSPVELAAAYAVVGNGGFEVFPYGIVEVRNGAGTVLYSRQASPPERLIRERIDWQMVDLLRLVIGQGTGKAANPGRPAAGKTGTSQNYRNAWFVGFTGELAAAVWLGNDDMAPMKTVTGGAAPARIWASFMRAALKGAPVRALPEAPPDRDLLDGLFHLFSGRSDSPGTAGGGRRAGPDGPTIIYEYPKGRD